MEHEIWELRVSLYWEGWVRFSTQSGLLFILIVVLRWICVRACTRPTVVEKSPHVWRKKADPTTDGGGGGTMMCQRGHWLECRTFGKSWIMSDWCCGRQDASQSKTAIPRSGG